MVAAVLEADISLLGSALDGLAAVEPSSLGDRSLGERCAELLAAAGRVDALLAATIAEAEHRGLCGARMSPAGLTGAWVGARAPASLGRAATARLVVRAGAVAGLPLVAGLHAGGEISTAFLDAAGAGLRALPREAHPSWDALLSGEARDVDPGDIGGLLAHLKVMVDPDQASRDADAASSRSELRVSPYGTRGAWAINGTLHGLEGELFTRMIAHYAKPRDAGDTRTRGERQAAALLQLCRIAERASRDPDYVPAPRGTAGHIVVLAAHATWTGAPGAPAATTEATVLDPGQFQSLRCATIPEVLLHGPAETATGAGGGERETAEADARLVRDILAGLIDPALGTTIEPLAYARNLRSASRAQWFALIARDRHCVLPDCRREPSWCEAHHTREWDTDHGPTDLENLALVCWEHHLWLHRNHQHLHPPWCHCQPCDNNRRTGRGKPHQWHTNGHPPSPATPKTANRRRVRAGPRSGQG